ncbi:MAG: MupG family TIM beta-alpha barrel fold protein [Faecalicoccus sp.]|uniref:DUF871 domain-containing protein n=1 Tax=Faecalicoccus sp. TaxID=1971758 RepID=UPI002F925237
MHKLGISIYPEHSTWEKDVAYMEKASRLGFSRIFTCLLSVTKPKEEIIEEFSRFVHKAHELGFEVAADTAPFVFEHLGATPEDLSIFHEIGLDIIRLDCHFDDRLDVLITRNPYGIKIEFNGSSDANVASLIKHGADPNNVIICHNFYPEPYSGLSYDVFANFNANWNQLGLHTAAFVSSHAKDTYGPWHVFAGLPTLEMHRNLPISVQVRHLLATEMIDDILIGNAIADESELEEMAAVDLTKTTVTIDLVDDLSNTEKEIIFDFAHTGRTDASEYYIRSSWPRVKYKGCSIPPRAYENDCFQRGDVVLVNDNLEHYRGELEVILKPIPNDGQRTFVGHIPKEEMIILDEMEKHPDHVFGFIPGK